MEASVTSRNTENVDSNQGTEIVAPTIPPSTTHLSSLELQHSPSSTLTTNISSQSDELTSQQRDNKATDNNRRQPGIVCQKS